MLGVGNRGKRAWYMLKRKSAVYKSLFWTSCRTSAPPVLGEGESLTEVAPEVSVRIRTPIESDVDAVLMVTYF